MKLKQQSEPFRQPLLVGAWAVLVLIVLSFFSCTDTRRPEKEIYAQACDFIRDRDITDSIQLQMLAEMERHLHNDSLFYASLKAFSRRFFEAGNPTDAFEFLINAQPVLSEIQNGNRHMKRYKSYSFLLLGLAAEKAGVSALSQEYNLKGLQIASAMRDTTLQVDFHNNIGASYMHAHSMAKALSHFEPALKMAEEKDYRKLIGILNSNMAEIFAHNGENEKAIDHMLRSYQSIDPKGNPDQYYVSQTLLGNCYLNGGNLPMAYTYLSSAFRNLMKGDNLGYQIIASMALVNYFESAHMPDSVAKYMNLTGKLVARDDNPENRARYLEGLARYEMAIGHAASAYEKEHELRMLRDSLSNQAAELRAQEASRIYAIEHEISKNNRGIASWNPVVVFVVMSIFVCTLLCFIVWILVMKRKKDRATTERAEAAASLAALRQEQLDKQRADKEKADEDLRMYHQKLTSSTLERLTISQQVEQISATFRRLLIQIPPRSKELRETVKEAIGQLASINYDTQWEEFQFYFEKVHPDFYTRLDKAHPRLTAKERRLCALVSLGLSSKEIAAITFLEVRSVESSRNRLRKKLGLENDQNLFEYISSFTAPPEGHDDAPNNMPNNTINFNDLQNLP